jgi:TPR repeat protein
MRNGFAGAVLALLLTPAAALADAAGEAKLAAALELFNAAAFWSDGNTPNVADMKSISAVIRWVEPVRAHIGPSATSSLRGVAEERLREVAAIAGVPVEIVDVPAQANLKFVFVQEYQVVANLPSAGCATEFKAPEFKLTDVTINVRLNQPSCMLHELMHAFGFGGHPHQQETVLSYSYQSGAARALTEPDRLALRALYHAGLEPATFHLPAMMRVRQYLAEELGLVAKGGDASHLARPVMDRAVDRLRAVAANDNALVSFQLGVAYARGEYVAVDLAQAYRYWEIAADKKLPVAVFNVGLMLASGQGVRADLDLATRRLRAASELGHPQAPFVLARIFEEAGNRPEAFAFYDLSARRGFAEAATRRDALGAAMSGEEGARAKARARELPTEPSG